MYSAEEICDKLAEEIQGLHINRIIEADRCFYFFLSDKFGNDFLLPPLGFDKESGKKFGVSFEDDLGGVYCHIPVRYTTYRNMVTDKLYDIMPEDDIDAAGEYGIEMPINALFRGGFNAELADMFAICHCFVKLFLDFCDEDEKNDFYSMLENPIISEFLDLPLSEKLERAKDYYFMPPNIQKCVEDSDGLFWMAMNYRKNGALNEAEYREAKELILKEIEDCRKEIDELDDPVCNKQILTEKIDWVEAQVQAEIDFCENVSQDISDRMKALSEMPSTYTDSEKKVFGEFKKFTDIPFTFGGEE